MNTYTIEYRGQYANTLAKNWTVVQFPDPCIFSSEKEALSFIKEYMDNEDHHLIQIDKDSYQWNGFHGFERYEIRLIET